jgi:biopolymer transport protein TolR
MGAKLGGSGGGGRRGRRGGGVMSDINVTPFVDVMLVLLVIFMVTAPMMTAGVPVDLPKTKAKAVTSNDNKPLEISLDEKGVIYIGDTKMTPAQMMAKLAAIVGENPDLRVYLRADQRLDYGKVMNVMAEINAAGFTKIALITEPKNR